MSFVKVRGKFLWSIGFPSRKKKNYSIAYNEVVGNVSHEKRKFFHKNGNYSTKTEICSLFLDLFPLKLLNKYIFPNKLDISLTKQ